MLYNVWMEGFHASGESERSGAALIGSVEASDFQEACNKLCKERYLTLYNPKRRTVWGCRLFDNESDAREVFG